MDKGGRGGSNQGQSAPSGHVADGEVTGMLQTNKHLLYDGTKPVSEESALSKCTFNTLALPEEKIK